MIVPAISLWQPYASLVFAPEPFRKAHETRGRKLPDNRRGARHAIHATAAKIDPRKIPGDLHRLCVDAFGWDYRESLPRGCVIGTVILADYARTEDQEPASAADRAAGIWTPERFAWRLDAPEPLVLPIPMPGRQSWFSVDIPA